MNKVYVGNLPWSATEEEIREFFSGCGDVSEIKMVNDRDTGRFRGFCFVQLGDDAGFQQALTLDGKDFGGRALKINEAQDKPRDGGSRKPRDGGYRRY